MFRSGHTSEISDEEAMSRFQGGDADAFDLLLARHGAPVLRFIKRMLGLDDGRAEDLMQDVFVRLIERRASFDPAQRLTTWLYAIARNRCIDHLRVEGRRRHASLDDPAGGMDSVRLGDSVSGDEGSQEARVLDKEVRGLVEAGLGSLSDELREVFLLREVEDLPLREIAEITGAPLGTVKSRLRYAYRALRVVLSGTGYADG